MSAKSPVQIRVDLCQLTLPGKEENVVERTFSQNPIQLSRPWYTPSLLFPAIPLLLCLSAWSLPAPAVMKACTGASGMMQAAGLYTDTR